MRGKENTSGIPCVLGFSTNKRLSVHVKLHYIGLFCPCGFPSQWREYLNIHQKDSKAARSKTCRTLQIYKVGLENFPIWKLDLHCLLLYFLHYGLSRPQHENQVTPRCLPRRFGPAIFQMTSYHQGPSLQQLLTRRRYKSDPL